MSYIVGLDPSLTSFGIAIVGAEDRGVPSLLRSVGEEGRKEDAKNYPKRMRRIGRQKADVIRIVEANTGWDIALAVMEGPIYGGSFTGNYFDRAILFGGVYSAFSSRNIPIAIIPPTTGHTFTTGKGSMPKDPKAFKPLILSSVRALVPDHYVANDDIADALGLAFMGQMALGHRPPFRPQRWQHAAVHGSQWPHGAPKPLAL